MPTTVAVKVHQASSQKVIYRWPQYVKQTAIDFQKKSMNSGVNGYDAPYEFAEMSARVDLSMERKM